MQHGDGEYRQRQYRAHNHQLRQRLDLIGAFSRLSPLGLRRIHNRSSNPQVWGRDPLGFGRAVSTRAKPVLIRTVLTLLSLNPQQPMHHIHAACKRIFARRQRR